MKFFKRLFQGRVGRNYFTIYCIFASTIQVLLLSIIEQASQWDISQYFILAICFVLFVLILSLWVKRLHDVGRSGYWTLLLFLPLVNLLMFVYLVFAGGQKGVNKYGKKPSGSIMY